MKIVCKLVIVKNIYRQDLGTGQINGPKPTTIPILMICSLQMTMILIKSNEATSKSVYVLVSECFLCEPIGPLSTISKDIRGSQSSAVCIGQRKLES